MITAVEMIPTRPRSVTPSPWKLYIEGVILSIPVKETIRGNFTAIGEYTFGYLLMRCNINPLVDSVIEGWVICDIIAEHLRSVQIRDDTALSHGWRDNICSIVLAISFIATRRSDC